MKIFLYSCTIHIKIYFILIILILFLSTVIIFIYFTVLFLKMFWVCFVVVWFGCHVERDIGNYFSVTMSCGMRRFVKKFWSFNIKMRKWSNILIKWHEIEAKVWLNNAKLKPFKKCALNQNLKPINSIILILTSLVFYIFYSRQKHEWKAEVEWVITTEQIISLSKIHFQLCILNISMYK